MFVCCYHYVVNKDEYIIMTFYLFTYFLVTVTLRLRFNVGGLYIAAN